MILITTILIMPSYNNCIDSVAIKEKPPEDGIGRCKEHKRELSLFCRNKSCQKPICSKCLAEHKTHDVVDIDEKDVPSENHNNQTVTSATKGMGEEKVCPF